MPLLVVVSFRCHYPFGHKPFWLKPLWLKALLAQASELASNVLLQSFLNHASKVTEPEAALKDAFAEDSCGFADLALSVFAGVLFGLEPLFGIG